MLGLGATMTGVVQAQSLGPFMAALLMGVGLGALAWLVVQERRAQEPIIPVALLRNRVIAIGNFGSLTIGALLMCVVGFLPTYVQAVMGRSAAVAGFVVATLSVAWSIGSITAGRVMAKTSYRTNAPQAAGVPGSAGGSQPAPKRHLRARRARTALWRSCIAAAIHSRAMLRSWSRIS
jgi:hypothetical protein